MKYRLPFFNSFTEALFSCVMVFILCGTLVLNSQTITNMPPSFFTRTVGATQSTGGPPVYPFICDPTIAQYVNFVPIGDPLGLYYGVSVPVMNAVGYQFPPMMEASESVAMVSYTATELGIFQPQTITNFQFDVIINQSQIGGQ